VPFLDLEVFAKTFDILDQVPGRVCFETRAPTKRKHTHTRSVDGSEARGLWVKRTAWTFRLHADPRRPPANDNGIREMVMMERGRAGGSPDLVLVGIEEAAIFRVASSAGTTSVRG